MNIHLPAILGFTRYQGFDPSPYVSHRLSHGFVHWQTTPSQSIPVDRGSSAPGSPTSVRSQSQQTLRRRRNETTWDNLGAGRSSWNGKLTWFYGVVTCNHGWRYLLYHIIILYIYMYIIYIGMDRNMNFASCHILRWLRPVVSSDVRQLFCQAHGVAKAWFWGPRLPASRNQHSLYMLWWTLTKGYGSGTLRTHSRTPDP